MGLILMHGKVVSQSTTRNGYVVNGIVYQSSNGSNVAISVMDADDFFESFGDHVDLVGQMVSGPLYFSDGQARFAISKVIKG